MSDAPNIWGLLSDDDAGALSQFRRHRRPLLRKLWWFDPPKWIVDLGEGVGYVAGTPQEAWKKYEKKCGRCVDEYKGPSGE